MSLRVSAGGARANGGIQVASSHAPRSTWPYQPMPLPPSSRGRLLLAKVAPFTALTVRDRGQLAQLGAQSHTIAPARQSAAITTAARQHNFRPVRADRGWRRPYTIPAPPGSGAGADGGSGGDSSSNGNGNGGCCG